MWCGFLPGRKTLLHSSISRGAVGPIQWILRDQSSGVNPYGPAANHMPPYSGEVKNQRNYICSSPYVRKARTVTSVPTTINVGEMMSVFSSRATCNSIKNEHFSEQI